MNFEYEGAEGETADFIMTLFRGNPHFSNVNVVEEAGTGVKHTLCYFKDETIQYSADDRFVPGGYRTTLAESLVAELFNNDVRHMKYITEPKAMFDDFEDDYCPCAEYCAGCCKEDIFE